jgi:hypothetical protein
MKILHNLLKGVSLTGALFVFQACYGMPNAPLYEEGGTAPMTFILVSQATGAPIEGVRILGGPVKNGNNYGSELGVTGADGTCSVSIPYRRNLDGPFLRFEDSEGHYVVKDTTLADLREREIVIKLNPR